MRIWFAGGCFWGTQHYFRKVRGVTSVRAGYANGNGETPTYEQVYTDSTGFAETVEIEYDPAEASLEFLVEMFFLAIDPLSLNRQGGDEGTRYRTGIYYSSEKDLPIIRRVFDSWQSRFSSPLAVEVLPLENFFPAEEYHQNYLEKNPGGYCHLRTELFALAKNPEKIRNYILALREFTALAAGEEDSLALMANAAAILKERMGFFWVGFYLANGSGSSAVLSLGPFQGPPACMRIPYGKGVCGTALAKKQTIIVSDVEAFPGHIACSSLSQSEIVVPVFGPAGEVKAVLDIDSTEKDAFGEPDASFLERFVKAMTQK